MVINPAAPVSSLRYKGLRRSSRPITLLRNLDTMEVMHLLIVYLLVVLSVHVSRGNVEAGIEQEGITEDQQKVHDECRNPDYKRYLKCLIRPRRHHHIGHGDGLSENGRFSHNNRDKHTGIRASAWKSSFEYYATTSVIHDHLRR